MSKDNSRFFKEKKIWSEVKDSLLACYLVPYFSKIMMTKRPLLYIDCFAGKGKFEDGKTGSPLNALGCLSESLLKNRSTKEGAPKPEVYMRFIESNHAQDLWNNLPQPCPCDCKVIEGAFELQIGKLLNNAAKRMPNANVFLYVDPYGIKALNMPLFQALPKHFSSAELLINLNSFGFLREALRVRKIALKTCDEDLLTDLDEYDSSILDSLDDLNTIAGGDYWQEIVDQYKHQQISMLEAEKRFAECYKMQLRKSFRYVLDMPIRLKSGQNPKYRLVFATNHVDGCTLMADNIFKRGDYLVRDIQHGGQMSMFETTPDNEYVDEQQIDRKMSYVVDAIPDGDAVQSKELLADFFNQNGVICATRHLNASLARLESGKRIQVTRPGVAPNSKYWTEQKGKKIFVRRA